MKQSLTLCHSVLCIFLLWSSPQICAQNWILFADAKDLNQFPALSAQAIQNRKVQGISLDDKDIPVNPLRVQELGRHPGIEVRGSSRWLNAVFVQTSLSPDSLDILFPWITRKIHTQYRTMAVQGNEPVEITGPAPKTAGDYGFANVQTVQIGLDCLHDKGFTGENVKVAIFDSGFRNADQITAFDSLRAENRLLQVYDFVNQDQGIYDEDSHGLHVFSVMAARRPGLFKGSAWKSSYILARTETVFSETTAEETNWIMALEWADSLGTQVIQSSLGYNLYDGGAGSYTYADLDGKTAPITLAAAAAVSRGIILVVSAGNEGSNSWMYVTVPADADTLLAVGSVNSTGQRPGYSSIGPTADGRIKPDVVALGENTAVVSSSGNISSSSGTSFAAPLIAGMGACLRQAHPSIPGWVIMDAIRASGDQASVPDNQKGYGIPQGCRADSILQLYTSAQKNVSELAPCTFYPNPARDILHIQNTRAEIKKIHIYSSEGKLWDIFPGETRTIPLDKYPAGMYYLRVETDTNRFYVQEVIVGR